MGNNGQTSQLDLVKFAMSGDNRIARRAIQKIRQLGLLEGDRSILQGLSFGTADLRAADLRRANLRGVDFSRSKLEKANLWQANMERANLTQVNLRSADLIGVDLRNARLAKADLTGASLDYADLREADLRGAILSGVNLWQVTLNGAVLDNAWFDDTTIMPDGKSWDKKTDISRFTDESHPDSWLPPEFDLCNLWDIMNARFSKPRNLQ